MQEIVNMQAYEFFTGMVNIYIKKQIQPKCCPAICDFTITLYAFVSPPTVIHGLKSAWSKDNKFENLNKNTRIANTKQNTGGKVFPTAFA